MAFQGFLANINIGFASAWDVLIIILVLIAAFIYGFLMGRNRMILFMLCTYFSLAIVSFVPWAKLSDIKWLGIGENPSSSLIILFFLALMLFFFIFVPRSVLSSLARVRKTYARVRSGR